jgi:DNA polymerase-1
VVAIDTETTSLNEMTAELVGVSLSTSAGRACYIPLGHKAGGATTCSVRAMRWPRGRSTRNRAGRAEAAAGGPAVLKIGRTLKYDVKVLARYGSTWRRSTTRC